MKTDEVNINNHVKCDYLRFNLKAPEQTPEK